MLTRNTDVDAPEPVIDGLTAVGADALGMQSLMRFYFFECGILYDRVVAYAVLSSLSRSGLIFAINHIATNPGLNPLPIAILASAVICTLLFAYLARMRNFEISRRLQRDLRLAMSRHLLNAGASFLQRQEQGQVINVMTHEVGSVSQASNTMVQAIEALLVLLVCIPYLAWVSWPTAIATTFAVAVGGLGFLLSERPARILADKSYNANADFYERVVDMLSGWMELRLRRSRREGLEADIEETIERSRRYSIESERYFSRGDTFTQFSLILLLCAIVVVLPLTQGAGTTAMFQLLTVVLLTYGPVETIFGALPTLSRAVASQHKISSLVRDLAASREPARIRASAAGSFRTIELRNVTARVVERGSNGDEVAFVLGPINLTFTPAETVFICGGNGAGKTTLLAIITGLRTPDSGEILLDGQPLAPGDFHDYRAMFSAVFSKFHLFRKTYGLDGQEREMLEALIEELGLSDRIKLLEHEFSTIQLSSGQRRRLALAVALAENRPIVVLDEFAADQDPQRRAFFYDVLVPRMARDGHLVIAVTHDEHNFSKCDRLIRMDSGHIVSDIRMKAAGGRQQDAENVS